MNNNTQANNPEHDEAVVEAMPEKSRSVSVFAAFWREIKADKKALVSLFVVLIIMIGSVIWASTLDMQEVVDISPARLFNRRMPPSWQEGGSPGHFLGTDDGGRCVLSLMVFATRNSLFLGFGVAIISILIGVIIGIISGFYGGHVDNVMMRIVDTWSMLPGFMFMIALIQLMPGFTIFGFMFILVAFTWMGRTRLIRGMTLQQANLDYVKASKTLGTPNIVIIFREVMPNLVSIIAANVVLTMSGSIGIETGMSMLGYGLPIDTPSLGTLLNNATLPANLQHRWWMWLPAVVLIFIMTMAINFLGQAVSRVADPRQRIA